MSCKNIKGMIKDRAWLYGIIYLMFTMEALIIIKNY